MSLRLVSDNKDELKSTLADSIVDDPGFRTCKVRISTQDRRVAAAKEMLIAQGYTGSNAATVMYMPVNHFIALYAAHQSIKHPDLRDMIPNMTMVMGSVIPSNPGIYKTVNLRISKKSKFTGKRNYPLPKEIAYVNNIFFGDSK